MVRAEGAGAALALLDGPGRPVLAGSLGDAGRALVLAGLGAGQLFRASEGELDERFGDVDELRLALERVTVALTLESAGRGMHTSSGLSLRDWLSTRCPWMSPGEIGDLAVLANGLTDAAHAPVREALAAGEVPVRRAARVLRALGRVRKACDEATYEQDVQIVLGAACQPVFTDADLQKVTDKLISAALPQKEQEDRERSVRALRGVNESSLADGSLVRFVVTCEPEGAAFFRQVLRSPLAAPAPDAQGPDPRTATQRRYDALVTVLGRGVGAPAGSPGTAKAKLMVLVGLEDLAAMVLGGGAPLAGGPALSPTMVRKLACEADLVPMILGKDGQLLETVQPTRFATERQLLALYKRDGHCTFPGCTVPPEWCAAHHVTWWSRGGKTYLLNLALLCQSHHTIVHERDLTAAIDEFGVTWHV